MSPDLLAESRDGILEHMNTDHRETMALYLRAFRQVDATANEVSMSAVTTEGFTVTHASRGEFHFAWSAPVADPEGVRRELVQLARAARQNPRP